tara:strand:- start:688 stop:1146 length:459 start_codon:yes stop_codon:yes gene_type:complete
MAQLIDNLDDVIKQMARLEKTVDMEVIRDIRKKMRATMEKYVPLVKQISPKDTGQLVKSVKVRSRSKRGVTNVRVIWGVPYAGPLNFRKTTKKTVASAFGVSLVQETERANKNEKYATDFWNQKKKTLEQEAVRDIKKGFEDILGKYGIEIK